jgi:subtilase family serine protease
MVYYLKGGREHISFKGPDKVNVKLNGSNIIPANTPPGIYYLGVVIDAGNKVKESN